MNQIDRFVPGSYELCPPGKRESLLELHRRLQPLSLLVCDMEGRLVFGQEWLRELRRLGKGLEEAAAQYLPLREVQAWLLSYRLLDSFHLAGLYEQLNLWRHVSLLLPPDELRKELSLPFPLHENIRHRLEELFAGPLKENLERDELVWQVLFRIMERSMSEWPAWSRLFAISRFSRSRQVALMDAVEEIQFREKQPLQEIIDRLSRDLEESSARGETLWERVYRLRYPRTAEMEASWNRRVKDLDLPVGVSLRHVPFFESGQVELNARFGDFEKFLSYWRGKTDFS